MQAWSGGVGVLGGRQGCRPPPLPQRRCRSGQRRRCSKGGGRTGEEWSPVRPVDDLRRITSWCAWWVAGAHHGRQPWGGVGRRRAPGVLCCGFRELDGGASESHRRARAHQLAGLGAQPPPLSRTGLEPLICGIPPIRSRRGPRRRRPGKLHADKGYGYDHLRRWLRGRGAIASPARASSPRNGSAATAGLSNELSPGWPAVDAYTAATNASPSTSSPSSA